MDRVRGLLTRWREKVFALLVQQKIQEIDNIRKNEGYQRKVCNVIICSSVDWLVHCRRCA